ncbi:IS3 family transposase [Desulfosporosinus lacus]
MKHYSGDFKLSAVEEVLTNHMGQRETARKYGVTHKMVQTWIRLYLEKGKDYFNSDVSKHKSTLIDEIPPIQILDHKTLVTPRRSKHPKVDESSLPDEIQNELNVLRMENEYLKKLKRLSPEKGKVTNKDKAQIVHELRRKYKVNELVKIAGIPRSTYYYYTKSQCKLDKYAAIRPVMKQIFTDNKGRYGYRRITAELKKKGLVINHKTVMRLMKELNLHCFVRIKKYNSYRGDVGKVAPNLLNREFQAAKPNEKWVTDITEFHLYGQKIYLSPILDLYNGEIISYDISNHPRFSQVMGMLDRAFKKIPDNTGLILHSDQGWQYRMAAYQEALVGKGIHQSMSRKATCLDNAVVENFFGHLKSELLYNQEFESVEHFVQELHAYLEYYNHKRIKKKLNYMSPIEYRLLQETA